MADVEQVEGSGNIDNLLARLGAFAVGKLEGELLVSSVKRIQAGEMKKPG